MKIAKTYKEFCKIKRKYYKRNSIKRVDHFNGKRFVSYWEEKDWIGYIIETFDEYQSKNIYKDILLEIGYELALMLLRTNRVKELYENKDQEYRFHYSYTDNKQEQYGKFVGIIITNRDAYFLIKDKQEHKLIPMFWRTEKYYG